MRESRRRGRVVALCPRTSANGIRWRYSEVESASTAPLCRAAPPPGAVPGVEVLTSAVFIDCHRAAAPTQAKTGTKARSSRKAPVEGIAVFEDEPAGAGAVDAGGVSLNDVDIDLTVSSGEVASEGRLTRAAARKRRAASSPTLAKDGGRPAQEARVEGAARAGPVAEQPAEGAAADDISPASATAGNGSSGTRRSRRARTSKRRRSAAAAGAGVGASPAKPEALKERAKKGRPAADVAVEAAEAPAEEATVADSTGPAPVKLSAGVAEAELETIELEEGLGGAGAGAGAGGEADAAPEDGEGDAEAPDTSNVAGGAGGPASSGEEASLSIEERIKIERPAMPDGVVDVYADRVADPFYVTEYINDVATYLMELEKQYEISPTYMEDLQPDINASMRAILVDWLVEVAEEYRLLPETLYVCVNYIDRCLSKFVVSRSKLQLLGCACMLVASKFEEIYAPAVDEFVYISDNTYSRDEILQMESIILKKLDFRLMAATPRHFIKRFISAAEVPWDSLDTYLARYILELSLQEYRFVKFSASHLAAAAIYASRLTLRQKHLWTPTLKHYTQHDLPELAQCTAMMLELHRGAATNQLQAVHEKFSHSPYMHVATAVTPMADHDPRVQSLQAAVDAARSPAGAAEE